MPARGRASRQPLRNHRRACEGPAVGRACPGRSRARTHHLGRVLCRGCYSIARRAALQRHEAGSSSLLRAPGTTASRTTTRLPARDYHSTTEAFS